MLTRAVSKKAKMTILFVALLILPMPTSSQIDNCCFVDRQCNTDEQWVKGYWAYQNNQCAAPSQSSNDIRASNSDTPSQNDNCCFIGWQCDTDQEWASGYFAFQNDQCDSQSQWEEQWRQQQNGDQQQERHHSNQQQEQEQEPEIVSAVIDVTDRNPSVHHREGGPTIIINPITREQMCTLFPGIVWCEELFGRK